MPRWTHQALAVSVVSSLALLGVRPAQAEHVEHFVLGAIVGYLAGQSSSPHSRCHRDLSREHRQYHRELNYEHRDAHRELAAEHREWHYDNDDRFDPWYDGDHARVHRELDREHRDWHYDAARDHRDFHRDLNYRHGECHYGYGY